MLNLLLAFMLYAGDNQNQFPVSFDQAVRYFPDAFNADPVSGDVAEFIQATNQFEIVYRGLRVALTNARDVIVLRERQARQWPDGKLSDCSASDLSATSRQSLCLAML